MRIVVRAFVALAFVLVVAAAVFLRYAIEDDRALPAHPVELVIPAGSDASEIASLLAREGVVRSALPFRLDVRLRGIGRDLRAGEFLFPAHETPAEVARRLTQGGSQVARWVTIPEGYTARQIAETFASHGIGTEAAFEALVASQRLRLPDGSTTANLEGYLFPDTYLVPVTATPAAVTASMTDEFRERLPADAVARARALHVTLPQIVTIASMIEREGQVDADRPLIASVIDNRLRLGMRLQIDATLEYTLARHETVITRADLARDTPYNTYLHAGLPPTPIANPGSASIEAALHPASTSYLYYVAMGNGRHAFARTLAEHNANVARYLP